MKLLCLDFINNQWYEKQGSKKSILENYASFVDFCLKWKISVPMENQIDRESLLQARSLLSNCAEEIADTKSLSSDNLKNLNHWLTKFNLKLLLEKESGTYRWTLSNEHKEKYFVEYEIFSSFVDLITQHPLSRVKKCDNNECGWFFYDESKNQTKRWCCNKCASLIKVRRFRAKKQTELKE